MIRRDTKPLVGAPIRVDEEVREGFMEGPDRRLDILLEEEERLSRRQDGENVLVSIETEEHSDRRNGIRGEDHGAEH